MCSRSKERLLSSNSVITYRHISAYKSPFLDPAYLTDWLSKAGVSGKVSNWTSSKGTEPIITILGSVGLELEVNFIYYSQYRTHRYIYGCWFLFYVANCTQCVRYFAYRYFKALRAVLQCSAPPVRTHVQCLSSLRVTRCGFPNRLSEAYVGASATRTLCNPVLSIFYYMLWTLHFRSH